jgi:hypothetical protein
MAHDEDFHLRIKHDYWIFLIEFCSRPVAQPVSFGDGVPFLRSSLVTKNELASVVVKQTNKLHSLSPRANYTDRATAACRQSDCQLLRIEGATWSA